MAPSIHDYCKKGDSGAVLRCLEEGGVALLEQERASGFTPLMLAAWYGHDDVVSVLLQHGADANRRLSTASYANGVTPLFVAARNGWPKVVMLLLGARADPELRRSSDGSTPLATAAKHGRTEVIQVLVRAGVAIDSPDSDESTPLLLAAKHGHPPVVELLLKSDAEPNGSTAWRPNALVVAAHQDDVAVIDAILRAKPGCVNMKLPNGATALHMAAACGNVAATTRLLDAGANPERCRRDGQTAASLASANGHIEVRQIISESLAIVEGRRPAVSKMQRLKRLQQSAKVMQGLGAKSAAPSEGPGSAGHAQQQLGRGARAFASLGLGQTGDSDQPAVDQRPSSSASIRSRSTGSGSQSAEGGSDDDNAGTVAPAWAKLRLVSKLSTTMRRGAAIGRDADQLIAMKREIVDSVGLLSKKGYQLAMDMLAVDGNTDGVTLELDDLSPELVRGLHALVIDSTHHSKRHRHRSRHHRGSSKADSAEQQSESSTTPDANPAADDDNTDPAKDAGNLPRSQEPSDKEPTAATESDKAENDSGHYHRHDHDSHRKHHHHHHHHDSHHKHHHRRGDDPSSNGKELNHLAQPDAETDGNDGSVRLPPIVITTDAAGSDPIADVGSGADPIDLPEIEGGASSRMAISTTPAGHSSRSRPSHSRGSSRSSHPKTTAGPAARTDGSSEQDSRDPVFSKPAKGLGAKERRGSAASVASVASGSTVVSAQTDSEDERIATALR
eukprot:COSAG02_NODE_2870_length_7858_cov_11.781931_1_plen_730_part_00